MQLYYYQTDEKPMRRRHGGNVQRRIQTKGHKPALHVLDNECSRAVTNYITKEHTDIQLVEPHNHRVNAADPAVKCVKYHMLASFATLDPNCPIQL